MQQQTQPNKHPLPTPEELEAMMVVPAWLVHGTAVLLQILIYGLPAAAVVFTFVYSPALWFSVLWVIVAPVVYAFLFAVTAGLCSLPWQRGIIKGVFPRDVRFPIYAMRKLYNTCWTALYYFKPVYNIVLSVAPFKAIVFRLFGYKGSLNITIFPDTWIRDLPLLRIEDGVYVANRATLGSNICLQNGYIMVGNITLKKNAMLGHLSVVGLGFSLGERSEVGVRCVTGVHVKIGDDTFIGSASGLGHKTKIGNKNHVGVWSYIGEDAVVGDNLAFPSHSDIPEGSRILSQEEVERLLDKKDELELNQP